ncbi:MAG: type II toxin-antitoxin system HipA family toxin [Betaproteobacteria bacterium]|nr:type II toxin-antitoxin system HipA family toxin [Betaproteobacteria bacterium]MDE2343440.1 type II toxin-antitoxin system HipA family toxin [Betaproteobacteria bacterium]
MRSLSVWVSDREVGTLQENPEDGTFDFIYRPDVPAQFAVSLTMPVGLPTHEYTGFNRLPPPFEVSLPEGFVLDALRRKFAKMVDVDDDFSLLELVGRHTVGRVTFGGPLAPEPGLEQRILAAARSENSARQLAALLKAHPQTTGISGVMPKMSSRHGDETRHPGTALASGVLVKFDTEDYPGAALVEFACMSACQAAGLPVPHLTLSPDASSLTIGRFDVTAQGRRLGFEDACALSGIARHGKYRGTVLDLFRMIDHFIPAAEGPGTRQDLLQRLLANDILRNGDAHLKNFGLIYDDPARPGLAPVYDVLTTTVWIPQDLPALRLTPQHSGPEWLTDSGFGPLAELAGIPAKAIAKLHAHMKERMVRTLRLVLDGNAARQNSGARAALKRALRDAAS